MNTATVGASADVGKLTSSAIKKVLGPAAFLVTGEFALVNLRLGLLHFWSRVSESVPIFY